MEEALVSMLIKSIEWTKHHLGARKDKGCKFDFRPIIAK